MEENFDATPCPVKAGSKPNRKMASSSLPDGLMVKIKKGPYWRNVDLQFPVARLSPTFDKIYRVNSTQCLQEYKTT